MASLDIALQPLERNQEMVAALLMKALSNTISIFYLNLFL